MKIEINYCFKTNQYHWKLYDGPDGIDEVDGYVTSLGDAFEQIIIQRTKIALDYF